MSNGKSMFSFERPSPIFLAWGGAGAEQRAVHGRNKVTKEGEFKDAGKEDVTGAHPLPRGLWQTLRMTLT